MGLDSVDYSQHAEQQNPGADESLLSLFQNAARFWESEPDRLVECLDFWRETLQLGKANIFKLDRLALAAQDIGPEDESIEFSIKF
jgi:hypothetical protein